MPKKFAIMTLALAGITQPLQAFEFTASMSEDLTPLVEISRDDSGITVDYTFPGAQKIADDLYPGTFKFAIPGDNRFTISTGRGLRG